MVLNISREKLNLKNCKKRGLFYLNRPNKRVGYSLLLNEESNILKRKQHLYQKRKTIYKWLSSLFSY